MQKKNTSGTSETFDIIKHGPTLKEKSPETSPKRDVINPQPNQRILNTFAHLIPCETEDHDESQANISSVQ